MKSQLEKEFGELKGGFHGMGLTDKKDSNNPMCDCVKEKLMKTRSAVDDQVEEEECLLRETKRRRDRTWKAREDEQDREEEEMRRDTMRHQRWQDDMCGAGLTEYDQHRACTSHDTRSTVMVLWGECTSQGSIVDNVFLCYIRHTFSYSLHHLSTLSSKL